MDSQSNLVRIAIGAERDLTAIHRRRTHQRGEGGPDGADALIDELVAAMESLDHFAGRGPLVPELEALGITEYHQLTRAPFRIVYHLDAQTVTVLIVADARRDFQTLLAERLLSAGH